MNQTLTSIEVFFRAYATQVPLEWFVFVGSFLEEVISPIPSALIMGTAGSLALVQGKPFAFLIVLAIIGNFGKLLGARLYYFLGDKAEDLFAAKIKSWFGLKHEDVEALGKRFNGNHWKDGGLVFLLRVIPFIPAAPVSLAAGIIRIDLRIFLVATYLGNFVKDSVYLCAGFIGIAALPNLWRKIDDVKYFVDILVFIGIAILLVFLYVHRGKGKRFLDFCRHCYVRSRNRSENTKK